MTDTAPTRDTVLFLSWRDIEHPRAGGAEVYTHEVLRRLVARGYSIWHLSTQFQGGADDCEIDGVRYVRKGDPLTVVLHAMRFYRRNRNHIALVVDQCNTHRFLTPLWVPRAKRLFFIHQLTREIWYRMLPRGRATAGFIAESAALWLNRNDSTVTVSKSTRDDLLRAGFRPERVDIAPEGLYFQPWPREKFATKVPDTFVCAGRLIPYKGAEEVLRAFGRVRRSRPECRMWMLGRPDEAYFANTLVPLLGRLGVSHSRGPDPGDAAVHFFGYVDAETLRTRMSQARALVMASQREGWGLTITEAAAVGTPSIVWPAPGVVDAVDFGRAGFLCDSRTIESLASTMCRVLDDESAYQAMREAAYQFALGFDFDTSAEEFDRCIARVLGRLIHRA